MCLREKTNAWVRKVYKRTHDKVFFSIVYYFVLELYTRYVQETNSNK
jgi:hypothetical protein